MATKNANSEVNNMGMYDVVEGITVYCPKCGKLVEGDWKTKSMECQINRYKPGDRLRIKTRCDCIEVYAFCPDCLLFGEEYTEYMVRVWLLVQDGVLTGELC